MITQKILAQLLDKATDPDVHSIELSWESPDPDYGPHPVIKITRKDSTYVPLQLCPKCEGDGHLGRHNSLAITSGLPICDICHGNKVIPMIKSTK